MIRALWYFLLVAALAAIAAFLAGVPGEIVATIGDTEIAMSVATALGLVGLVVLAAILAERVFTFLVHGPANVTNFWTARRQMRGYEAFSRGMLAVASGDAAGARRYAQRAHDLLDHPGMTLLLSAQAAQLSGDRQASGKAFQAMLAAPETHGLALKGLYEQAMAAGQLDAAYTHATRALDAAPDTAWAFEGKFALEARMGEYERAMETLDRGLGQGLLERADARRRRAVLLTAIARDEAARILEPSGPRDEEDVDADTTSVEDIRHNALRHAVEARDLAPGLVPAAAIAARLVAEDGRARRAQKIIEDTWARSPHPELATVFLDLYPGEAADARLKRAEALAAKKSESAESHVLIARAAIGARDFDRAREVLKPYAEPFPSRRICLLMAEIAEKSGDMGRTREWLSRSVKAPADAQWVADGYRTSEWVPVVPVSGAFDALEWRAPSEAMMPVSAASTEEAMARAAETVVLPSPSEPPRGETPKAEPGPAAADTPPPPPAPAPPIDNPEVHKGPRPAVTDDVDFLPPPPDDPGPDGYEEDDNGGRGRW